MNKTGAISIDVKKINWNFFLRVKRIAGSKIPKANLNIYSSVGLDDLRALVQDGPAPLFATISGAHLYGFPSPDSDIDLRGVFVLALEAVLRLREPQETITMTCTCHAVEIDWVAHDVRKFARLMTRRNGYVLEQLYSPLVVWGGAWLNELREIGRGCIVRHLYHHYRGFTNRQLDLLAKPNPSLKDLLYAYRVLLTGIYVLRTGHVEANLIRLNERFKLPGLDDLAARKMTGAESGCLLASDLDTHRPQLASLETQLAEAFDSSALPDEPVTLQALDDYVVRARLELGRHE